MIGDSILIGRNYNEIFNEEKKHLAKLSLAVEDEMKWSHCPKKSGKKINFEKIHNKWCND